VFKYFDVKKQNIWSQWVAIGLVKDPPQCEDAPGAGITNVGVEAAVPSDW